MELSIAQSIRNHASGTYIDPARRKKESTVKIVAGDVVRSLKLKNRTPAVCQALAGKQFLRENNLKLEQREGPPSGLSTTTTFTYRLGDAADAPPQPRLTDLLALRGIARDVYAAYGGGEAYLRQMRKDFYGPGDAE